MGVNIGVELGERKVKIEAGTGLEAALDQDQEEVGGDQAQEKAETGLKMIQEVGRGLDQEEGRRRGGGEESSPDLGQNITTLGQDLPQEVKVSQFPENQLKRTSSKVMRQKKMRRRVSTWSCLEHLQPTLILSMGL